jgi:nicotinate-nucleotide adenylyltransferase
LGLSVESALQPKRIGMFGGAFDPPHRGHAALAEAALAQFGLDALHVIPTGQAWHKSTALNAPAHRLAMTRLAFADMPRVIVDDRELQRAGPTFTFDTLQALQRENPLAQLYLFIGADQFAAFGQWHRWREICELAIICIADRLQSALAPSQWEAYAPHHHRFFTLKLPLMPVSSTQVRQLMASGDATAQTAATLVPEPVARYISVHQLYRPR